MSRKPNTFRLSLLNRCAFASQCHRTCASYVCSMSAEELPGARIPWLTAHSQQVQGFMLRNPQSCSEDSLCIISAMTYTYWTICIGSDQGKQMFSLLASKISDTFCAQCKVSYAIEETLRVLTYWNKNADSILVKTLILIRCKLYGWAEHAADRTS